MEKILLKKSSLRLMWIQFLFILAISNAIGTAFARQVPFMESGHRPI